MSESAVETRLSEEDEKALRDATAELLSMCKRLEKALDARSKDDHEDAA
jgi:hypothetical protein